MANFNSVMDALNVRFDDNDQPNYNCNCHLHPDLINSDVAHVVTGNVDITSNPDLKFILRSGPKFRLPCSPDWNSIRAALVDATEKYTKRSVEVLPQHANFSREVCAKWIHNAELEVNRCSRGGVTTPDLKLPTSAIKSLKDNFDTVVTDKASQNFSFICKKFYCDKINQLLNSDATYSKTNFSVRAKFVKN